MRAGYLEMLADKEREAVDGHDGTLVGHPGLVTAALTEFNKSVPMAHQMSYQRKDAIAPADLVRRPEGTITVESLVGMLNTTLRALAQVRPGEALVQGGRIHDRSSIQLSLALLWQWVHSRQGVITSSGLEVHDDLVRYLVKKASDKLLADPDPSFRNSGRNAGERLLHLVLADEHPVHTLL
jgi:malate synthase